LQNGKSTNNADGNTNHHPDGGILPGPTFPGPPSPWKEGREGGRVCGAACQVVASPEEGMGIMGIPPPARVGDIRRNLATCMPPMPRNPYEFDKRAPYPESPPPRPAPPQPPPSLLSAIRRRIAGGKAGGGGLLGLAAAAACKVRLTAGVALLIATAPSLPGNLPRILRPEPKLLDRIA
jgi:hypothetical protein